MDVQPKGRSVEFYMSEQPSEATSPSFHRFLDEAGDTTFYGRGRRVIVGQPGVSKAFCLGSVKFRCPLAEARLVVEDAVARVTSNPKLKAFISVQKRIMAGGFFFQAKDDPPPIRELFFDELKDLSCSLEIIVARKIAKLFETTHRSREDEFYADILGHLLKGKLRLKGRLVLTVAQRGSSTRAVVLERALALARSRAAKRWKHEALTTDVVFDVQNPRNEPLLAVADYLSWSVQRVIERGETQYYDSVSHKIRAIQDIYDVSNYQGNLHWYNPQRPLGPKNKISPPSS